jgi:hypothetical protein
MIKQSRKQHCFVVFVDHLQYYPLNPEVSYGKKDVILNGNEHSQTSKCCESPSFISHIG